jgi:predicted acylesterase/phospholipase RssA/CRP-like cAMP-binding protein
MTLTSGHSTEDMDLPPLKLQELLTSLSEFTDVLSDADLDLVELAQDEILFKQGDLADSMYVLIAGMLGVRILHDDGTDTVVDKLSPGAIVGEMGILAGRPRSATIFALNSAGLIRIGKSGIKRLIEEDEEGVKRLAQATTIRWQRLQLANVLKRLFGQLDVEELHAIQDRLEWISLSNGEVVFRQGDPADGMYIVVSGRLRVVIAGEKGVEQILGEVPTGDLVGEFAILTDEPRSATVYAVRETTLVKMTPEEFKRLVQVFPEFMTIVSRLIVERQLSNVRGDADPRTSYLTLALVPVTPEVDVKQFATELGDIMHGFGNTLVFDKFQFDKLYGKEGASSTTSEDPSYPAVVAWMNEQEIAHDFLIYVADPDYSTWTCHCISQSDRVLMLADTEQGLAEPGPVEKVIQEMKAPVRTDIILWHPVDIENPTGTAAWLDGRQIQRHFHLRKEDPCHMQRFARQLTCQALGLVLSGGGARAFAHLGVYKAIKEVGMPLDHIGGTSMGSLIAALFALDMPYARLIELASELADNKNVFDYTLPLTSVAASKKVTKLCQRLFGDRMIEDLWIPFFCVSSNLTRGEPVVHRRGPMWRAVRSSISIPGVFTPMMDDGDLLVDGSPMNNFPVDIMIQEGETRRIIGVLASPQESSRRDYQIDGSISGWRILFSRLNPFSKPIRAPSLIGTVLRSMEINSVYQNRKRHSLAELVIYPDVKRFSGLDFGAFAPIVEQGYQASIEPLSQWMNQESEQTNA